VLGPFSGRLSNSGETLELRNNDGRLEDSVSYGTDGDWPVGPDGAGVSLAKVDPNTASGLAENWATSTQVGGTPGAANFPSINAPADRGLVFNETSAATNTTFWLELSMMGRTIFRWMAMWSRSRGVRMRPTCFRPARILAREHFWPWIRPN